MWVDSIYPSHPLGDNPAFAFTYNGDGTMATQTMTFPNGHQYRRTYTYTGGRLTGITKWTKL